MKKPNSTVVLNSRTRLINNYLAKLFYVIEQDTKQLSLSPNDVILRTNINNQLDTDYVMVKNKAISAVANTTKKLNIQKDMHMIYKQDFHMNKEKEIYDLFLEYIVLIMENLHHPALIVELKQNIDATAYEKI